jgi:hypothetical protein
MVAAISRIYADFSRMHRSATLACGERDDSVEAAFRHRERDDRKIGVAADKLVRTFR